MEEFERLEAELRQLYESYVLRFRCVTYLEQQYEAAEQAEQERMEERQVSKRVFPLKSFFLEVFYLNVSNITFKNKIGCN